MGDYLPDSHASLDLEEIYPHHQAAITLMHKHLESSQTEDFFWLDLFCGQGQILVHFNDHFSLQNRSKITYHPYDINVEYVTMTCSFAKKLNLKNIVDKTGHIHDFKTLYDGNYFDFITITSSFHEINPFSIPKVLTDCLSVLRDGGILYLYDVEKLSAPELGSLCLRKNEIAKIINAVISAFGISDYSPNVSKWPRKKIPSWSTLLMMEELGIKNIIKERESEAINKGKTAVREILSARIVECTDSLNSIIDGSLGTTADHTTKIDLLFEYFALKRYLEEKDE